MIRRSTFGGKALRGILCSWTVVLLPSIAHAQWAERDAGKVLFQSAREALARGDKKAACEMFEKSHVLDPEAVGPLVNLADCETKPGSLVRALALFEKAFNILSDGDERKAVVGVRLRELESRVPIVTIERGDTATATVHLDGRPLDEAVSKLRLEPGHHRIVVAKNGRQNSNDEFELSEGSKLIVVLHVGPPLPERAKALPPLSTAARSAGSEGSFAPGLIVLGVGVTAIGAGIATRFAAADQNRIVNDHCDDDFVCDSEGFKAASRGKMWTLVSSASLVAGTITTGVGAYLIVNHWRNSRRKTTLSAMPFGNGPGISLRAEF